MKTYGITNANQFTEKLDLHLENIRINGYSIEEGLFEDDLCDLFSMKLEDVYSQQLSEFGKENLAVINELNTARIPFAYDTGFTQFFMNSLILELASKVIGNSFHLHLQNGIINRPEYSHHQSSWHRDLPYQEWTTSKPLAFNAFICLSDFSASNGSTIVLPYSHNLDVFPSTNYVVENQVQLEAKKGSVIFFNSMLFHKAGVNSSTATRYGLNNMFVIPILKQQISLMNFINQDLYTKDELGVLGSRYEVPLSVQDYRTKKINRKINEE